MAHLFSWTDCCLNFTYDQKRGFGKLSSVAATGDLRAQKTKRVAGSCPRWVPAGGTALSAPRAALSTGTALPDGVPGSGLREGEGWTVGCGD